MSMKKLLVVVHILEGRNFSSYQDCSLVVDGVIDGQLLSTDPIPQDVSTLHIQTELAWEMEHKTLQQHRLCRTPIKLQVFTVDNATSTRKIVGYILLDLRTAKPPNKVVPTWYKLLNSQGRGPPPELRVCLAVEEQLNKECSGDGISETGGGRSEISSENHRDGGLLLHPSGEYYSLGASVPEEQLFVVSVTLSNPSNLPESVLGGYHYCYKIFEVELTSEVFTSPNFKAERASIRIMGTEEKLKALFSHSSMEISLCKGGDVLGEGTLSLEPLLTGDSLQCQVQMKNESDVHDVVLHAISATFVDVGVKVLLENSSSSISLERVSGESQSRPFVQRSLARSFDEAYDQESHLSEVSVSKPAREEAAGILPPDLANGTDQHSPDPLLTFPANDATDTATRPHSPDSVARQHLQDPMDVPIPHQPDTFPLLPDGAACSRLPSCDSLHNEVGKNAFRIEEDLQSSSAESSVATQVRPAATVSRTDNVCEDNQAKTGEECPPLMNATEVPVQANLEQRGTARSFQVHTSTQTESPSANGAHISHSSQVDTATHHYKYSIEIHSIHSLTFGEGLKCYIKYVYPYFGCWKPVLVEPAVSLVLGAENHFSASPSSFKFASNEMLLKYQLSHHPLTLEVWTSGEATDSLVGIAKVPLGEVFSGDKVTSTSCICHRCSLKVPVLASAMTQITCAYINCTLVLEDQGPVQLESTRASFQYEGMPSTAEYMTAMELEMWKVSEEEAFTANMKMKEALYLRQLQDEWRRREEERQRVFTHKVEAYSNLEAQLRTTLEAAQKEHKKLMSKEVELQEGRQKLLLDEQCISRSCEARVKQLQLVYEGKLEGQRARAEELLETVERLKKQVSVLNKKLASREAEFDGYRQQVLSKPESKLQAELTMVHMEKAELEKKLSSALKSKQHYKEQWNQAMKQLATLRQKEQDASRHMLQLQQQELKRMQERQMHSQEQRLICETLSEVKDEVARLQCGARDKEREYQSPPLTDTGTPANPDVARWIEERDILLQTGVYTHSDFTIQNLDQKIKAALKS